MIVDTKAASATSIEAAPGKGQIDVRVIWTVIAVAIALGWIPRLMWGFWTDEAGTYWMAIEGWRAAIERTTHWAGQSVLYSILESFFARHGPGQEFLVRIPSLASMAAAAWQLKRIAELMVHPSAGWLVVLPFLCAPETIEFGTSARPYALALAAALASFRYLLEWHGAAATEPRRWLVKYLTVSILTLYLHYLFGFIFVVQGAYLLFCWWRRSKVAWTLPVAAVVALPLSLLPLVNSLRITAQTTSDFTGAAKPTWSEFLQLCFPPLLLLGAGLGIVMLLASARNLRWRPAPVRAEHVFLTFIWLLVAPAAFFAASTFTNSSVFSARYLLFTLPAFLLILAWAAAGLERQNWRQTWLIAIFAACVLHPAMLMYVFHESPSSWRPPLKAIAQASVNEAAPVFVASGMANSGGLNWQEHDPASSSLYAALTAYPIPNRTLPLPFQFSQAVQDFVRAKFAGGMSAERHVWLLAESDSPLASWMSGYLAQLGYRAETRDFNKFVVVEYRRP
jgi:hypothetical protein